MKFRAVVALAVFGFAGLASSVALGRHAHQLACTVNSGAVDGYHVTARHSCSATVTVGAAIYRVDTLKTVSPGTFDFHTPFLAQCHEGPSASDVIAPTSAVAIKHLTGTTWCRHAITDAKQWLVMKNAKIFITGTIVGLTVTPQGSLIQLAEGTATVTVAGQTKPTVVPQNSQLIVPFAGAPGKPTALVLSPADQQTVKTLQLGVVQMGAPQAAEHLRSRGETSAVVIGDTGASAKKQAALLPGVKVAVLSAAQVRARPTLVAAELERLGAHSVITVGAFEAIEPTWELMQANGGLPIGTAIVYATP